MKRTSVKVLAGMLLVSTAGCPGIGGEGGNGGSTSVDGNRDPAFPQPGEPNGSFNVAIQTVFDAVGVARLQGTVVQSGDLDVFKLGPMSAGDRLVVDAYAFSSSLDVTIAVFDAEEKLVANNDDRADFGGQSLDALVDFIVRHGGAEYYLVVSNSPFGSTRRLTGGYRVEVEVTGGAGVPPPTPQTLVLNFDGGEVTIPSIDSGPRDFAEFDAGAISQIYEGQTEAMKQRILEVVEQNFERFDITVLSSDDAPPPAGARYSTVHIGCFSPSLFGIADAVDFLNLDRCDDAYIFAESFSPAVFSTTPTAEELGTAIANVATHEAGHILGLNHTDDDTDLMDDTSPADAFLFDQEFKTAPLSGDIVPIGFQDGVLLLEEIVGPR